MSHRHRALALSGLVGLIGAVVISFALPVGAGPEGETVEYRHEVHQNVGLKLNCEGCHASTSEGRLTFPGADNHKPCSNANCHAADFREAGAKLCFACHKHNDPWRANPIKTGFKEEGEFYVAFSHKSHIERAKSGNVLGQGCGGCHPREAGEESPTAAEGRLAAGHVQCASCHEALASPKMTMCNGCHKLGSGGEGDDAMAADSTWRVHRDFKHDDHRLDVRTAEQKEAGSLGWKGYKKETAEALPCGECHGEVAKSDARRLPHPTMAGCGSCHDGTYSFKVTGFSCPRCHGPAQTAPTSEPASEPASQPRE